MKPNLYYYWEGEQPAWIELCLQTIKKHCQDSFNFKILNNKNVEVFAQLPPEYFKIERPAHRTDFLKAKLIYETGGFWIDSDTIVLQDFSGWVSYFDKFDFIGTPGFFGGPKNSPTIRRWYERAQALILDHQEFHFSELIDPLIREKDYDPFKVLTKEQFLPIWYTAPDINKFWDKDLKLEDVLTEDSKVVVLFNNCFPDWFRQMSKDDILKSDMFIGKLYRKALE